MEERSERGFFTVYNVVFVWMDIWTIEPAPQFYAIRIFQEEPWGYSKEWSRKQVWNEVARCP
jgi:hypothetical protein